MKKLTKVLFVTLVLAILPLKQWAQTPYRQYSNDGILLNAFEIDNLDFRVFLFYNLGQDERFEIIVNEQPGQFSITSSDEEDLVNLSEAFETFYRKTCADFSLLSKVDIYNQMTHWKSCIPSTCFASMMLDITSETPDLTTTTTALIPTLSVLQMSLPLTQRPLLKQLTI